MSLTREDFRIVKETDGNGKIICYPQQLIKKKKWKSFYYSFGGSRVEFTKDKFEYFTCVESPAHPHQRCEEWIAKKIGSEEVKTEICDEWIPPESEEGIQRAKDESMLKDLMKRHSVTSLKHWLGGISQNEFTGD